MKNTSGVLAVSVLLQVLLVAGQGIAQRQPAASWSVLLRGVREDTLKSETFEEAKTHRTHYETRELESRGIRRTYGGMPLYMIAAVVDGPDAEHPYTADRSLWESGYDITITGRDGYAATFNTAEVGPADLILADNVDGQPIPPMIAGNAPGSLWVRDVVEIELSLAAAEAEETFRLVFDVNGNVSSFTREELERSRHYVEGRGRYTTSAGTTYDALWGGVRFAAFLEQFVELRPESTVTLVAMDGYQMSYSGEQLLDTSEGTWLLAFRQDGVYLPRDPGYVRTIKVGPGNPDIPGHSSVRMVERVVIEEQVYRDFSLRVTGRMDWTLDRQTIQSGISCHNRTVSFERRGQTGTYTGIPLYLLLAYADDPEHAPHKQTDRSILSYRSGLAREGYEVVVGAADAFEVTLDSRQLDGNEDVILAMYKDGEELPDREFPLVLVWDKDAEVIPDGIKPVRQVTSLRLVF